MTVTPANAEATAPGQRRQALALLARMLQPERRPLAWASLWLVAAGLLEAAGPVFGKHLIDAYLLAQRVEAGPMGLLLVGYLATGLAASLLRYRQLVRMAGIAMRAVARLRERVYAHVLRLPVAYFDRALTGQLVSRITNDTEAVKQLYVQVLFEILQGLTVLAGALVAMAWLDWRLMLIVAALVPATVLITWGYQRLASGPVARGRAARSDINAQMAESIAGVAALQAAGAVARFRARFEATNAEYLRARMGEVRANAWLLRPALDLLSVLLVIAVVAAFGASTAQTLEVGLLYAFIAYIARVTEPLIQITMQFSVIQQSVIAAARVNTLLAEGTPGRVTYWRRIERGEVTLQDVTFGYDPAQPVLHDLTLRIAPGAFVGIVGHTGSGKSTLLALLLRFYAPQAGRIEIDGIPLSALDDAHFRAAVAVVPQEPFLLAGSARDNLDMGRGLPPAAIESAARAAHLHELLERLPQGYDTPLGEGGALLSAGQKQLLALARALAGAPRVLLLDEATARIDSETEQRVQQALAALRGRVTVIAIAHRLSTVRAADRIVVLNRGRIVEQGTHEQLMAIDGGVYQRLYQLQRSDTP